MPWGIYKMRICSQFGLFFSWYNCPAVCGSSAWWLYSGANGNLLHEDLCHMLHLLRLLLQRPRPHGRSLLTYASAEDPHSLTGRSGSLSFGHHCSFPWVLVHTRCLCPPSVYLVAAPKYISSVQFSRSVVSDFLWSHRLQHARLPCPSPTPGAHSNPCPLSQSCHPTISSSVVFENE